MDAEAIGKHFVQQYYQMFDTNRQALASIYRDDSVMLFEGSPFQGATAIVQKLMSLSFQKVEHAITTIDSVLTIDSGLLIMVVGQLKTDNDPIHTFSETFYLKQFGDSLFVMNSVFRLSLHHQA